MICYISRSCVRADELCNFFPIASTFANLINIIQKAFLLPCLNQEFIQNSHYYSYLDKKSFFTCGVLLIPFVGNFIFDVVVIAEFVRSNRTNDISRSENNDVKSSSDEDGPEIFLENQKFIQFYGDEINAEFDSKTDHENSSSDPEKFSEVSTTFSECQATDRLIRLALDDPKKLKNMEAEVGYGIIVNHVIKNNPMALEFASRHYKNNYKLVRKAYRINPESIKFASERVINMVTIQIPPPASGVFQ